MPIDLSKLDPRLAARVEDLDLEDPWRELLTPAFLQEVKELTQKGTPRGEEGLVPVIIRSRGGAAKQRLSAGIQLNKAAKLWENLANHVRFTEHPEIVTARLPLRVLVALTALDGVMAIELSRPMFLVNGLHAPASAGCERRSGAQYIGAEDLRREHQALDGQGVVIGIIDAAIDYHHPTFRQEDGTTRIESIWVQHPPKGVEARPPRGFDQGVEYTAAEINADLQQPPSKRYSVVPHRETGSTKSHGTRVAGLAAGNGRGADEGVAGVAPAATLIVVAALLSGDRPIGDSASLIDAVDYISTRAAGRPCVINISLGDGLGPHDGTSRLEEHLDHIASQPSRAIVVAAGNTRGRRKHARGAVKPGLDARLPLHVGMQQRQSDTFQIWYDTDAPLHARLISPNGTTVDIEPGARKEDWKQGDLHCDFYSSTRVNGGRWGTIEVKLRPMTQGALLTSGEWTLTLRATGNAEVSWDAWIDDAESQLLWDAAIAEDVCTVMTPATGRVVITVGDYNPCFHTTSPLSGEGPTMDDRTKPDIYAPGAAIPMPCAADWSEGTPQRLYDEFGAGTSIAAPHVTGAIALLLQWAKRSGTTLSPKAIRAAVERSTRHGTSSMRTQNSPPWGYLDVRRLLPTT